MKDLFGRLWFKFAVEVLVTAFLWFAYYVLKHLLPKKYRLKDGTIKKFLKDFNNISSNIASKEDGFGEVLTKSHNVFQYWYQERDKEINAISELKNYIKDLPEFQIYKNASFTGSVLPKLDFLAKTTLIQEIDLTRSIVKLDFVIDGKNITFYTINCFEDKTGMYGHVPYESTFACQKNFHYMKLTNLFFEMFNNRLFFTIKKDLLAIEKLEQEFNQENYLLPNDLFSELSEEIKKFKKLKIQRSYIFSGAPGTGKTTFCLELSKKLTGKIVKLDSKVFTDLSSQDIRGIIEGLDCDFIIVDDIDRIMYGDLSGFFYMLESIKNYANAPTLLATVNNIRKLDQAVLRPGRFDDIIDFELPKKNERMVFITNLLEKHNIEISNKDLELFADATADMSQAYLKEYCNQLRIELNIEKLITKINKRRKYLNLKNIDDIEDPSSESYGEPELDEIEEYDE